MVRDDALKAWERLLLEAGSTAARTRENYRQQLKRIGTRINLVDPPEQVAVALQKYRQDLQQQFESGKISRSYIRLQVAALRSFYGTLVKGKLYPSDPTVGLRSIASDEGAPRNLASQDVDRLFSAVDLAEPTGLRDLTMLWLYYHSLRNSEVAGLTTQEISYSAREEAVVLTFRGKGGKVRTVVLVEEAGWLLAKLVLQQYAPADWDHSKHEAVFESLDLLMSRALKGKALPVFMHNTKQMTRRRSNELFVKYREKAGLSNVVPHMLRHTCATNLLNADVDLRTVQEILGHASIRQTERYTAVLTSRKQQAMNRLPRPAITHA